MRTLVTTDGRRFLTHDTLSYSDYSGSTVERSNVRVLAEGETLETFCYSDRPEQDGETFDPMRLTNAFPYAWESVPIGPETTAIALVGGHGTYELWLSDTENHREAIHALDDYPCVSDEDLSALECDAEDENLPDVVADIRRIVNWSRHPRVHDLIEDLDTDRIALAYRAAMQATNTYAEFETGGVVYVDTKRIWRAFVCACLVFRHEDRDVPTSHDDRTLARHIGRFCPDRGVLDYYRPTVAAR